MENKIRPDNMFVTRPAIFANLKSRLPDHVRHRAVGRNERQHVFGIGHNHVEHIRLFGVEHPLDVDHRADIYALGVVFYQIRWMAGRKSFLNITRSHFTLKLLQTRT